MNKFKKYLLVLPVVIITSCGTSINYLVPGNKYNSPVFTENYYSHWDSELKNARKEQVKDVTDSAITKFSDLYKIDRNVDTGVASFDDWDEYGAAYKMNSLDDSFKYGYQSKLFDGQMVCGAQNYHPEYAYQLGRIQTDSKGFSVRFAKESDDLHYFVLQFKASTNNQIACWYDTGEIDPDTGEHMLIFSDPKTNPNHDHDIMHNSTVSLLITLYTKEGSKIVAHPYSAEVAFDNKYTNDGHHYVFLGFDLESEGLTRCVGASFQFEVEDELVNLNKEKGIDIDYALFLYEMFLPYTYWH